MDVSTQLRLLTETETPKQHPDPPGRPRRGRVNPSRRPDSAAAVHWEGRWRLDERTRQIGRAGIASARAALAKVHGEADDSGLRRAS